MNQKEQLPSSPKQNILFPLSFLQDEVYVTKEEEETTEKNDFQQQSIWPSLPLD